MPPRSITAVIVVFWLGVSGWAAWRTLAPYLRPSDPPPFVIDLADESGQRTIFWKIVQKGRDIGVAETEVTLDPNGLFVMGCRYKVSQFGGTVRAEILSRYHVTRGGELRAVSAEVKINSPGFDQDIKAQIEGPIQDGFFHPRGEFDWTGKPQKVGFDPVDMTGQTSMFNPLHPVNRITGLRAGRSWKVPLFEPLTLVAAAKLDGIKDPVFVTVLELIKSQQGQVTFRELSAQVQPEGKMLRWHRRQEMCWIIEYDEGDMNARTWVRQFDGLVLQQEAKLRGDVILLIRMPQQ